MNKFYCFFSFYLYYQKKHSLSIYYIYIYQQKTFSSIYSNLFQSIKAVQLTAFLSSPIHFNLSFIHKKHSLSPHIIYINNKTFHFFKTNKFNSFIFYLFTNSNSFTSIPLNAAAPSIHRELYVILFASDAAATVEVGQVPLSELPTA